VVLGELNVPREMYGEVSNIWSSEIMTEEMPKSGGVRVRAP